ncbi:MAG: pyridoxal phosphate-dependent aminotransferase [Deltaproteobacteria bacterium]|nr:pyridoxal phosphate-dependent aminotransferase [Deltaproteobacteria bacterium]
MKSMLAPTEAMGIYQMLYAFMEASGKYMGEPGTHPWSQGFPLTTQLPGGPKLPETISVKSSDLTYPKAWGHLSLRESIANYYNHFYKSNLAPENVMIFAGGRAALFAAVFLLAKDVRVVIEETEYTPYYDLLRILNRDPVIVPSNEKNNFLPSAQDYAACAPKTPHFRIRSNPCNPTGQVLRGEKLKEYVQACSQPGVGALLDEAYEFFVDPEPVSALQYIENIDETNIFVAGAATKGLQAPGIRLGWIVASRENVEILGNYSTFVMGGVSRVSQIYGEELLQTARVTQAREAVASFYTKQRNRYGAALQEMGLQLFSGEGGFYHWCKLPGSLKADEYNERLFKREAAILPGRLCDMHRRGSSSPLQEFFRFSFGPLKADSFEEDVKILKSALC